MHGGSEVDIMARAGASPDAVLIDKFTGEVKAVFEAKCKVPFLMHRSGVLLTCNVHYIPKIVSAFAMRSRQYSNIPFRMDASPCRMGL
jgi:hypothetical protein